MPTRIYLIRHGATTASSENLFAGAASNVPLSEEGRAQAARLAARLAEEEITAAYASTLDRAVETAFTDLIQELNRRFGGDRSIAFVTDSGGLPRIEVANAHATARIALNGGCVLAYSPHGQPPVLFLSEHTVYRAGKAIRGDIPLCGPWFGPHPTDLGKPQHGFARTALWQVSDARTIGGSTQVRLELRDDGGTRARWPHPFVLQLLVAVGTALGVTLVAYNPSG
jgi:hypothetical protein